MNIYRKVAPLVCLGLLLGLTGCQTAGQRLSQINPRHKREQSIETGLSVGRLQERQGEYQAAEKIYRELHEKHPGNPDVVHRLAVVQMKMNRPEQAQRYFELATKLAPNDAELLTDMGYACYLQGKHDLAEQYYRQALEIAPTSNRTKSNLALSLGMRGQTTESYALYREMHSEAEAHANIAYIHAQRGEGNKAIEHYSKSLDMKPGSKVAAQGLVQLAEMRNQVLPSATPSTQPNTMLASNSAQPPQAKPAVQHQPVVHAPVAPAAPLPARGGMGQVQATKPVRPPVPQGAEPKLAQPSGTILPLPETESLDTPVVVIPTTKPSARGSRVTPIAAEVIEPMPTPRPQMLPPLPSPAATAPDVVDEWPSAAWEKSEGITAIVYP